MSSNHIHAQVPRHVLQQVYLENIRDNQIGGETDGIRPEVAEDLGFTTSPEGVDDVIERTITDDTIVNPVTAIKQTLSVTGRFADADSHIYGLEPSKDFVNRRRRVGK